MLLAADTPDPEDGLVAVEGRETVPPLLRTALDARLTVLPTLAPPLIVPPAVLIVFLPVFPAVMAFLSVFERRP